MEIVNVVCDTEDCYNTAQDVVAAMFAHEPNDFGDPLFVVAGRQRLGFYSNEYLTYCTNCAMRLDFESLKKSGWEMSYPEGYTPGKACLDCNYGNFKIRWAECEVCNSTGWLEPPVWVEQNDDNAVRTS